ncbi:MAG: hypothetical protein ABEH66_07675 [Halobacteriales archaeon]
MSATTAESDPTRGLDDPPEYDLHCRFDDPEDPSEVTVFPGNQEESLTEQWISIEKGYALPVEEVR